MSVHFAASTPQSHKDPEESNGVFVSSILYPQTAAHEDLLQPPLLAAESICTITIQCLCRYVNQSHYSQYYCKMPFHHLSGNSYLI